MTNLKYLNKLNCDHISNNQLNTKTDLQFLENHPLLERLEICKGFGLNGFNSKLECLNLKGIEIDSGNNKIMFDNNFPNLEYAIFNECNMDTECILNFTKCKRLNI